MAGFIALHEVRRTQRELHWQFFMQMIYKPQTKAEVLIGNAPLLVG